MPITLPDEEYYRTLPRKAIGAGMLLFNTQGELLIVKPDYREDWLLPGGSSEVDESPLQCAIRETEEEIGLTISAPTLVGVSHRPARGMRPESVLFIFHGGTLTDSDIARIHLQESEIEDMRFLPMEEALSLLSENLLTVIPYCMSALKGGGIVCVDV